MRRTEVTFPVHVGTAGVSRGARSRCSPLAMQGEVFIGLIETDGRGYRLTLYSRDTGEPAIRAVGSEAYVLRTLLAARLPPPTIADRRDGFGERGDRSGIALVRSKPTDGNLKSAG